MGKYFGTDGFRGEANVNLTAMHAFKVGRFLGWYYGRYHKCSVAIGKDTRRSSYMFEDALSAGPVSYTHLDVYKRQAQMRILMSFHLIIKSSMQYSIWQSICMRAGVAYAC